MKNTEWTIGNYRKPILEDNSLPYTNSGKNRVENLLRFRIHVRIISYYKAAMYNPNRG
jgi:hypothetical protein